MRREDRRSRTWGWPFAHVWMCWNKFHPYMRTLALRLGWLHLWGEVSWWGNPESILSRSTGLNLSLWAGPLHLTLAGKVTHGPEYKSQAKSNPEAT